MSLTSHGLQAEQAIRDRTLAQSRARVLLLLLFSLRASDFDSFCDEADAFELSSIRGHK